jgi:carbohydrate-selective porin OprB
MEPKVTGTSNPLVANRIGLDTRREDADTGLHVEGFYKFRLSPNVLITPGLIWLTAPGHNDNNDDIIIGTIRTTFTF